MLRMQQCGKRQGLGTLVQLWLVLTTMAIGLSCGDVKTVDQSELTELPLDALPLVPDSLHLAWPLTVHNWFAFIDSIKSNSGSAVYPDYLDEYALVHANRWLIDSFANTDFDRRLARGDTVFDQRHLVILEPPFRLALPTIEEARAISAYLSEVHIDVNIPEYRLRLYHSDSLLLDVPARVGRNGRRHLEMAGHEVDLRTAIGAGRIVRINRSPSFIDPCSNKPYSTTRRDNGMVTKMPLIPWIEPEIGGLRPGHLIHPTTNPSTLGKALSNGCVGLSEAAAWHLYFHAPIGTSVSYRYDLVVPGSGGTDTILLPDIYRIE